MFDTAKLFAVEITSVGNPSMELTADIMVVNPGSGRPMHCLECYLIVLTSVMCFDAHTLL